MGVKVYSTPDCPYCKMTKKFLTEKGVDFEDLNVADDEKAREEMIEKSGQMGVPVLDVNGTIIVGFDQPKLEEVLGEGGEEPKVDETLNEEPEKAEEKTESAAEEKPEAEKPEEASEIKEEDKEEKKE